MKKQKSNHSDPELIRFENELKKLELSLKTGTDFHFHAGSKIPPEIENQFLKNIERFEEAHRNAKTITVHQKLGKPEFVRLENLSSREISEALKDINEKLFMKGISINSICPVDDAIMFTFIIDEIMQQCIDDVDIPGMMCCFIYEEFHPNHEYDINNRVTEAVHELLENKEKQSASLTEIENYKELNLFTTSFESFLIHHFNISNILTEETKALATFEIKFTGNMDGGGKIIFDGIGTAKLIYEFEWWTVKQLSIPI